MKNLSVTWWSKIVDYFKGYPTWLVQFAVAWSFAFFVGFLLRSLGKYIIFSAIVIGGVVFLLTRFDLATFHIMKIKVMLGMEAVKISGIGDFIMTSAKNNPAAAIGSIVGFFFGWSFGR